MGIQEILDQVDREMERAIKNPEDFEFKERNPYHVPVDPEPVNMDTAVVDLENKTAKIRYTTQSQQENYSCLMKDPEKELAIVQSKALHDYEGSRKVSKVHYLIHKGEVFRKSGGSYEQADLQTRPLEVANEFEDLYIKAMAGDNQRKGLENERETDHGPDPVPPPENDSMFPGE